MSVVSLLLVSCKAEQKPIVLPEAENSGKKLNLEIHANEMQSSAPKVIVREGSLTTAVLDRPTTTSP